MWRVADSVGALQLSVSGARVRQDVRVSIQATTDQPYATSSYRFVGMFDHVNLDSEPMLVRFALIPDNGDPRLVSEQTHLLAGDGSGRAWFEFTAADIFGCEGQEDVTCSTGFTVEIESETEMRGFGQIFFSFEAAVEGDADASRRDDIDPPQGTSLAVSHDSPFFELPIEAATPQWYADGAIQRDLADLPALNVTPNAPGEAMYFILNPDSDVDFGRMFIHSAIEFDVTSDQAPARVHAAVVPDDVTQLAPVEHVVTLTGAGVLLLDFEIGDALACPEASNGICALGFTLTCDIDSASAAGWRVASAVKASVDGVSPDPPTGEVVDILFE